MRRDLALGKRAHVGANLVERLVERPRESAAGFERRRAQRLDDRWHRDLGDRGTRGVVVARLGQPEQRARSAVEPMTQALRELAGGHRGGGAEHGRRARQLVDHARFGRRIRDVLDDDLVIVDRFALARQRASRGHRIGGESARGVRDRGQVRHAGAYPGLALRSTWVTVVSCAV